MTRLQYLLDCVSEECHEIGKLAMKSNRFGLHSDYTGKSNAHLLFQEVADLIAVLELLIELDTSIITYTNSDFIRWIQAKKDKIEEMIRYCPEPIV